MHRGGGTIGLGGIISAMSKDEIVQDLQASFSVVHSSEVLAYPYGDNTEDAREAVREVGLQCAFTTQYGRVHVGDDYTQLDRIRISGDTIFDGFVYSVS